MILAWDVSSSVVALLACISTLQTGRIAAQPNANSLPIWSGLDFYPCLAASRNIDLHLQGFNGFSNVLPLHNGHDTAVKWSRWENFSKAWSCLRQIFKCQQNSTPFVPLHWLKPLKDTSNGRWSSQLDHFLSLTLRGSPPVRNYSDLQWKSGSNCCLNGPSWLFAWI